MARSIIGTLGRAAGRRWRLTADDLWLLAQQTGAATVAWLIARHFADHHDPFFAPISAVVALNTPLGERGLNALRLLQGVVLGIAVGELALLALGGGYGTLAVATFLALVLARRLTTARIVAAQSAIAAILTIAVADGEVGVHRLTDALIGTGVALLFSQALFSPEPLRLLRRVEGDALVAMAAALDVAAQALDGDDSRAEGAITSQRDLRDQLSELARIRRATTRVARHSLVWRGRVAPAVKEKEDAGHLDLLGSSCLLLTRASLATRAGDQLLLAPGVRALSQTLSELARQPGDRETRQRAVERSLDILREMRAVPAEPDPDLAVALTAARIAVTDLLMFAGVDPAEARAATRPEATEQRTFEIPAREAPREPPVARLRKWFRPPMGRAATWLRRKADRRPGSKASSRTSRGRRLLEGRRR